MKFIFMKYFRNVHFCLFVCGLVIHFLYLLFLLVVTNPEEWNWAHHDTMTYVRPAMSFLETNEYLLKDEPDYRRTVGYPSFLAVGLKVAGIIDVEWRYVVYFLQALFFAFAYPAAYFVGRKLFGLSVQSGLWAIALLVINGVFVSYITVIMTDALFATFLICAVAVGVMVVDRKNLTWIVLHCALTGAAAVTRPIMSLFPFAMLMIYAAYAVQTKQWENKWVKLRLVVMCCMTLVLVQAPAIRNWVHHGVYTSSEHQSIVLYDYLAREVLFWQGNEDEYQQTASLLSQMEGGDSLGERIQLRKERAFKVFALHPISTMFAMLYNFSLNMVEFHWNNTMFHLFRVNWHKDYTDGSVLWSPGPYIVGLLYVMSYGLVYFGAGVYLWLNRKSYLLLAGGFVLALPLLAAATNYQGARFRLWFDLFVILASVSAWSETIRILKNKSNAAI